MQQSNYISIQEGCRYISAGSMQADCVCISAGLINKLLSQHIVCLKCFVPADFVTHGNVLKSSRNYRWSISVNSCLADLPSFLLNSSSSELSISLSSFGCEWICFFLVQISWM